MVVPEYVPERGDVVWLDFSPHLGHEQGGRRPGVVLSPRHYNQRVKLALLCPFTSRRKGYSYEVEAPAGLPISGVILSDQVRSYAWEERRADFICTLPNDVVDEVIERALTLLDPDTGNTP